MCRSRAVFLLACAVLACERSPERAPASPALHLLDAFDPQRVEGRAPLPPPPSRSELRFAGTAPAFSAGPGVTALAVRDGKLTGRTTSTAPVLRLSLDGPPAAGDFVDSVELRMRVTAGRNFALDLRRAAAPGQPSGEGAPDLFATPAVLWAISGPVVPDGQLRRYVALPQVPISSDGIAEIFVQPCDAAGAEFEIESIRLVLQKEALARVPSGPGWHGLGEIYRETLVARAPEIMHFPVDVPDAARLDLAVGTREEAPVRFRISARTGSSERMLAERTITQPQRWDAFQLDLSDYAGQSLELLLATESERHGAVAFWGSPVVRSTAAREGLQGVIVILADTLRPDHLDAYGHSRATAPALARMASEGVRFERAVAQASWTKISVPSLLLSLYATSHGIRSFNDRLPDEARTLAEVFREAGFATFASSANFFIGKLTHLEQGFEEFRESASLASGNISKTAREQVDGFLPWLEAHRDVPFFAYLHVTDPHSPYEPVHPYDTLYSSAEEGERHERELEQLREHIAHPLMRAFGMPTASELAAAGIDAKRYFEQDRAWYDASIRAMDVELARVFERLRELGLDERTVVVFASDHGEEFLEHGATFHGRTVYGEVTRVPLLFWAPGRLAAGRVVTETVQNLDVMPTLLELARVAPGGPLQGHSLVPLMTDSPPGAESWRARPAISEHRIDLAGPPWTDQPGISIEDHEWKLIENEHPGAGVPAIELYAVASDPLDRTDVAAQYPEQVERLRAALAAWRKEAATVRLPSITQSDSAMSAEEIERLKAMGYVQ
jgi:arylsulfatase A-like enzyme